MAVNTAYFEAGTNGNTVTTGAGEASATAWDSVDLNGTSTAIYDTTHFYKSLACKIVTAAGKYCLLTWNAAYTDNTESYGRVYLWIPAYAGLHQFSVIYPGPNVFEITAGAHVGYRDTVGANAAMTSAYSYGQWTRIEWHIVHSTTVGQIELKYFASADSTTATETLTSAANLNTGANGTRQDFGVRNTSAQTVWFDNIVAGAASYQGPAIPANTVAPAVTGSTGLGDTLTCDSGTWTGDATITYGYQWQRNTVDIGGATAATRVIAAADQGTSLRCVVTATNGAGVVSANSNATSIPAAAGGPAGIDPADATILDYYYS